MAAVMANLQRNPKKKPRPFTIDDFIQNPFKPKQEKTIEDKRKEWEELKEQFKVS